LREDFKGRMRSGLNANSSYYLAFGGAWLVFQKEIMLKESEIWKDAKISFAKMDEDS
jgi:hypothetical protein